MKKNNPQSAIRNPQSRQSAMSFVLLVSVFVSSLSFAQGQSRPRQVESNAPQATNQVLSQPKILRGEPTIRIGLATSVRSVSITTTAPALDAATLEEKPTTLEAARVRVEVRNLRPLPAGEGTTYQVEITDNDKADADMIAGDIKEETGEKTTIAQDEKGIFHIAIGEAKPSQAEAEELRARLDLLGFDEATIAVKQPEIQATEETAKTTTKDSNKIQMTSSVSPGPLREVAVYNSNAKILGTPAPISFGSENEPNTPVRLNGKPYRGRIEVFANNRGTLTVVNVLKMEDYVRGVVPNELSPGGYPQLEALKAQAVAARTYAMKNIGQFASQGFDLLPTTRSQVYRGYSSEHGFTNRAVAETSGMVATYKGEPIVAYYTSTCGGRTEDGENIFNENLPYLRGRECSIEAKAQIAPYTFKTSRETDVRADKGAERTREAAMLMIHGFQMSNTARINDAWLSSPPTSNEIRSWLSLISIKYQQPMPQISEDVTNPASFSSALARAVYGESRADVLFDNVDVEYLLPIKDASEIPNQNRADVAMFLREGVLEIYPDASLKPKEPMPRWMAVHAIHRLMEKKNLFQLQKATINQTKDNRIMLRVGKSDTPLNLTSDVFLFRVIGDGSFPVRSVALMGGEPVTYHTNASGQVDFLEVRPSPNGASAERMSPFTNWTREVSLGSLQARLRRWSSDIGTLVDLKVIKRGYSRRVVDLQLIGTNGTTIIHGGVIRSALKLREQLFVIDRKRNSDGRVVSFVFTGRGWGHGVGMCQVGAYGLAKLGLTYDKILKSYYSGIDVTKMY
jgi:stage II sporulation protein D